MSGSTGLLQIDLDALVGNWQRLCCRTNAVTAAVVKADAYGLGLAAVAPALYKAGCRDFFVATLEEAIALRSLLPAEASCLVLGGVPAGAEEECLQRQLVPVISSLAALQRWLAVAPAGSCAIKFDTGMTRLGMPLDDILSPEHRTLLVAAAPQLAMSHLACAEDLGAVQNRQQLNAFQRVREYLTPLWPQTRWSLANSSGIFLGADYHADLVRPGAALYGFNPCPGRDSPVAPVVCLQLPVLQLRRVQTAATVGYGAAATAAAGSVLAVAAGGYADGLHRLLGPAGSGFCAGVEVPVLGRVSMDTTVFDVTAVPGIIERLERGDWTDVGIDIIGTERGVSEISARNHSLGYEVLTSLGASRYRREYLTAGEETL